MSAETLAQLRAGALSGTVRMDLSDGLTELPPEILTLADSLEILNLSNNRLTDLPDWLPELKKLRILFCSNNPFRHVPEILGRCPALDMVGFKSCQVITLSPVALPPQLRWLILTDNRLTTLPPELGRCSQLQKLMLSGNELTALPPELAACGNLELLRLAANQFEAFPDWLWNLPSLAWLALSGNPCTPVLTTQSIPIREIPWSQITPGPLLGEGASGLIHQAVWAPENGQPPQDIALKLFKGAMTSDGLPASEMAACLAAGDHPACVGATGKITGHPDNTDGLVMPLLDPAWKPLAGPPSLDSCTRDIYPPSCQLTAHQALRLLRSIATAAAHLHGLRFLHGDLYAHNILTHPDKPALLSDFGAASAWPPGPADKIARIEVRAFGILLQEVLDHCQDRSALLAHLPGMATRCQQPAVSARPDFAGILAELSE
jgi:hypothetical protein